MGDDDNTVPNPKLEPLKLLVQMTQQSYSKKSKGKALKLMKMVVTDGRDKTDPAVWKFLDEIAELTESRQTGKAIKTIGKLAQEAIYASPNSQPISTAPTERNSNVSM